MYGGYLQIAIIKTMKGERPNYRKFEILQNFQHSGFLAITSVSNRN